MALRLWRGGSFFRSSHVFAASRFAHRQQECDTAALKNQHALGVEKHAEKQWQKNFQRYREFLLDQRDRQKQIPESLQNWLVRQRHEFQKKRRGETSMLTDDRQKKLQSLGVSFEAQREWSWDIRFEKLANYVKAHGGAFPYDKAQRNIKEQGLNLFCQKQRVQYKRYQAGEPSLLNKERIEKLNEIDFTWDFHESAWDTMYNELKRFHEQHGHCLVPRNFDLNPVLGKWVDSQRTQYSLMKQQKRSSMTRRRITLLNRLDFAWVAKEARWHLRYHDLAQQVKIRGKTMPTYKDADAGLLYRWLKYQKQAYKDFMHGKKTSMTQSKKVLLDELLGDQWRTDNREQLPDHLR